jgi:hypothetical protein
LASGGLTSTGSQIWSLASLGILGVPEGGDRFGSPLAAGDFDSDGSDDLAIGVPFEDVDSGKWAGAVNVLYGSAREGLSSFRNQVWTQNSPGIAPVAEFQDHFGWSLTVGHLNFDIYADLIVGVLGEDDGSGAINVLPGFITGLSASGSQEWSQGGPGVPGTKETRDYFGEAVSSR